MRVQHPFPALEERMVRLLRTFRFGLLFGSLAVLAGLTVLLTLGVGWLFDGFSGWSRAMERQDRLMQEQQATLSRQARRKEVARGLIEGKMTLAEAAAVVEEIHREIRAFAPLGPRPYPGLSDEEACCRFAIDIARDELYGQPERAKAVVARLEKELRTHRQRGTLRKPGVLPVAIEVRSK
jgi:hypothetical protein